MSSFPDTSGDAGPSPHLVLRRSALWEGPVFYTSRLTFISVALLLIFCAGLHGWAQNPIDGLTQHTWRMEDGLPDQEIQAIAQTADGFLWLGTPHGLVRFDDFRFREDVAAHTPTLRQFGVSCLLGARDGSLWAGAYNGGIARFSKGQVRVFGIESGLATLAVRVLYEDAGGTIWAGTDHGIFRLQRDRMVRVAGLRDPSIAAIVSDGAGGMWSR